MVLFVCGFIPTVNKKIITISAFANTNVGLVIYDDTILQSVPLYSIADKTAIKKYTTKTTKYGNGNYQEQIEGF
ncbi:hypothetical protein AAK894_13275 [Lachnospiraceae bacterium 46-61]